MKPIVWRRQGKGYIGSVGGLDLFHYREHVSPIPYVLSCLLNTPEISSKSYHTHEEVRAGAETMLTVILAKLNA